MGNLSQEELERKVSQLDYELFLVRREIGLTDSRWANLVSKMMSKIEPVKVRVERPKNIAETLAEANPYFYTEKPKQTLAQTWDQMWETGPMEEKQELLDRAVGYLKNFQQKGPTLEQEIGLEAQPQGMESPTMAYPSDVMDSEIIARTIQILRQSDPVTTNQSHVEPELKCVHHKWGKLDSLISTIYTGQAYALALECQNDNCNASLFLGKIHAPPVQEHS